MTPECPSLLPAPVQFQQGLSQWEETLHVQRLLSFAKTLPVNQFIANTRAQQNSQGMAEDAYPSQDPFHLSKVLANERRRYVSNVFSHWLRLCQWPQLTNQNSPDMAPGCPSLPPESTQPGHWTAPAPACPPSRSGRGNVGCPTWRRSCPPRTCRHPLESPYLCCLKSPWCI